jgi:hypothetical protein
MKFEEKHINFYKKFILQTKTLNDGGIDLDVLLLVGRIKI